jgi:hypothetical protein
MLKGTDPTRKTQCDRVLKWLEHKPITPLEAWAELGVYRLGARIWDLRDRGHEIVSRMVTVQNRFGESCRVAQYSMTHGSAVQDRVA